MGLLAFLVQDPAPSPDRSRVSATSLAVRMLADWRELDRSRLRIEPPHEPDGPDSLSYGDLAVVWETMDVPYPGDLPEYCRTSRLWPPSVPAPVDHTRHTIVTLAPGAGSGDAPADALLLTRAVASMVALDASIKAVVWAPAEHVVLPEAFRAVVVDGTPESLLHAWVACNVGTDPSGRLTGHTRGLHQLGLMDVEIPATRRSPEETLHQLRGLAQYQLTRGAVIDDGDTVGKDDRDRVLVRHAPSVLDPAVTVLLVEPGARRRGLLRRG